MSNFPQKITSVIKTFSSFIIVSLIAVLVVSCASSSSGGGTSSTPTTPTTPTTTTPGISVFSHSSYTFIHENTNITTSETVGRVLPKHAEIRKLVAAEIGVEVDDIVRSNYTIKYSFAGDDAENPSSLLNRYFSIDSDGIITVKSPFAFPVSLEDIFNDVPFVEVEMEITIRHANADKPLTRTVRVNFRSTDDALPGIEEAFSFDVTKVSEDDREEKQPLMEDITYTGELSGTLTDTALNGTDALIFTSLWKTATATPAENPTDGTIRDNVFTRITANDLLGLLNATETGLIQSIRVTFTPPSGAAAIPVYAYASAANASAHVSIEELNGNNTVAGSLLKAISDADVNNHYTMINADGVQVLNASIGWSFTYTYKRDFQPNPITILGKVELNRTVQFEEEQDVTKNIPIDGVKTALDSYGFTTKATEQRTIFFTLSDAPGAPDDSCNSNKVYLDNEDSRVKAAKSFNYEDLDSEEERLSRCVLAASFTGVDADYRALIAEINATTFPDARVNSNPISRVACDEGFNCYYASLTVNITDVDEAPTITPSSALVIAEGVGANAKYSGAIRVSGNDLSANDDTGFANISDDITIADTDEDANRDVLAVNKTETKVTSVSPAHGAGLFSIVKNDEGDNLFTLRVNATELDFEKFIKEDDLTAGKAIYMVTISTQDESRSKAGFDKVIPKTMQVPVEITDVRYAPVATGAGLGFDQMDNIENRSDGTIVLLPGASMLASGRNILGTVKAVNPETDSDAGLVYAVAYNTTDLTAPENNFAFSTGIKNVLVTGIGVGDGSSPQNLILRGLGLADNDAITPLTVTVFNPQDVALASIANPPINPQAIAANFAAVSTFIPINIVVDADAYNGRAHDGSINQDLNISRDLLLDPATAPTFTMRQLAGSITEGIAGANVSVAPSTPLVLYNPAVPPGFELVNVSKVIDITPAFAFVDAALLDVFGAERLGINTGDSAMFDIDENTGAISLKEDSKVVFPVDSPGYYTLVVRLANASDIDATETPQLLKQDYALVTVLVNDINTAPVVSDFTVLANPSLSDSNETADSLRLNITIDEDTPAGTVLATFTVEDDNDNMFAMQDFSFGAAKGSAFLNNAVKLTFVDSTATLTLTKSISFEDFATGTPDNVVIAADRVTLTETKSILDKGRYELNPSEGHTESVPVSDLGVDVLNASLEFNLIVRDVDEKPVIDVANSETSGSVSENDIVGTPVNPIAITIANVNATDADALVYELSGNDKFADVFNVTVGTASDANTRILNLVVADADKLEDLGDGLLHTATLTITNNTGGTGPNDASDPITIQVTVMDVQQPITPIRLSTFTFNITETDVDEGVADGDYDFEEPLFTFIETDISKDANEKVTIGRTTYDLINIDYSITNVSFTSLTPDVADHIDLGIPPVFSLKKPDGDGNVTLAINDTDYIEASLFGDITSIVTFIGTAAGRSGGIVMNEGNGFTLLVLKAAPKEVAYTTANANANAPVYGFEYTQSDYAAVDAEVAGDAVGENVTLATNVKGENGLNDPVGGRANQINVDGDNYNTTLVSVPSNSDINGYFIERGASEDIGVIGDNRHAVHDGTLVIRLDSNNDKNITITEILSEDASGKLVDITTFDNYFNIEINNTYNLAAEGEDEVISKVLLITQKQFDVINSTGGVDASIKYNALDTIALFKDATEETTRTYYIRASQEGDNASTYALAQFYVDIEAAGLNIPAVIEELYIHNVEVTDLSTALVNFDIDVDGFSGNASMNENDITPNQFDSHSLRLRISNSDFDDNQAGGATIITVSVPDGDAPAGTSKVASNNELIALTAVGGSEVLPGVNMVELVPQTTADTEGAAHTIEFALARNVYGTATININIQENDSNGKEIDSKDHEFTLTVTEDITPNADPTFNVQLTGAGTPQELSAGSLDLSIEEDTGVFAGDADIKSVTVTPNNFNVNDISGNRDQTATVMVSNIAYMDSTNGRNVEFFDYTAGTNVINYKNHGYGTADITYAVTETEPRGFADVIPAAPLHTGTATSTITLTKDDDPAEFISSVVNSYNLNDFKDTVTGAHTSTAPNPKVLTLTYSDPDIAFDTFIDAVPAQINQGAAPLSLVNTVSTVATTTSVSAGGFTNVGDGTFTVDFNYELILSEDQFDLVDAINAIDDGGSFPIPFSGPGDSIGGITTVVNVPFLLRTPAPDRPANVEATIEAVYIDTAKNSNPSTAFVNFAGTNGAIGENSIEPNQFGTHNLYIKVSNSDFNLYREGDTEITVTVQEGTAPGIDLDASATSGNLIQLADAGTNTIRATGESIVGISQTEITNDNVIAFALARNVHGVAMININIVEKDRIDGVIVGNSVNYMLEVTKDTSDDNGNNIPTITPMLTDGTTPISADTGGNFTSLNEDTELLNTGSDTTKSITIIPGVDTNEADGNDARRDQAGTATVASVTRIDDITNPNPSNPREEDIFDHASGATMTYQQHGWGITDIVFDVIETEPRGFGNTIIGTIYDDTITSRVTVRQVNDAAVLLRGEGAGAAYNLNDFENADGIFDNTIDLPVRPFTLTYRDDDLIFDVFSTGGTVPATINAATPTSELSPRATLSITSDSGVPTIISPTSTMFTVDFMSNFPVLSKEQYDAINALSAGGMYSVEFTGTDVVSNSLLIPIVVEANNHQVTLQDDSGDVMEGASSTSVGTIEVTDLDLSRALAEPEVLTFTIESVTKIGPNPRNIANDVDWQHRTLSGPIDNNIASNSIVVTDLDDDDVGSYTVTWKVTELYANDGTGSTTGTFTLNVLNAPEKLTLGAAVVTIDSTGILPPMSNDNNENITIATFSGITISGDDLNLPDAENAGILLSMLIYNEAGSPAGRDKQFIQFVDVDNTDSNTLFETTAPRVKYFISTADIRNNGGMIPAFRLVADDRFAGDELLILVNATLATDISTIVEGAEDADIQANNIAFNTNYDIQSPPSDVRISSLIDIADTGTATAPVLGITEDVAGNITISFSDRNIENNRIEELSAGVPIEAFTATLRIFSDGNNNDTFDVGEELIHSVEITDPTAFNFTEGIAATPGTGTVSFIYTPSNANVGGRNFEVIITDSRTEDSPVALRGDLNIERADSGFTLSTQLDIDGKDITQDVSYNDNASISALINITSEDFVEGGDEHEVTAFTLSNFGFYVDVSGEKGKDNQCSFGAIDLSMLEDVTASLKNAGHTIDDDTRTFRFSVGTQDFDRFTDNCIRLDYDIVGTFHSGDASVTLANQDSSVEFTQDSSSNTLVSGSINNRYDRTGFRLIAPSVTTVSSTANNVITGETITLEFNVTDNDDDDGPDNGIRDDRYRVELASIYGVCDITKWTVGAITSKSGDDYIYTVDVTTKSAVVSGDTCSVGIDVTEDGDAAKATSQPIMVSFVDIAPPTIVRTSGGVSNNVTDAGNRVIPVSGTSVNQELGTFTITRQVTSAEITTYGLALNVFAELGANCGGITISNGTQSGNNYPFTYTIGSGATEAAVCEVTIAATETASIGSSAVFRSVPIDRVTITPRREKAPVITALAGDLTGVTNYGPGSNAATKTIIVTATVSDEDADDNDVVSSNLTTGNAAICSVSGEVTRTGTGQLSWNVVIGSAGIPGPSNACVLTLNSEANAASSSISDTVELPELVPSISSIDYTPSATIGTNVPITVSLTDIDNDGKFGVFRVLRETGGCDLSTHTEDDGAMESVNISSSSEGTCTFRVNVTEDAETVISGVETIRFTLPVPAEAAPSITGKELNATTANINEIVSLTVDIRNADQGDLTNAFITAGSAGSSGCTVVPAADIVISSDSETGTQVFNITSATAGECIITVNTTEGDFTSANEQVGPITFMRPEVAPIFADVPSFPSQFTKKTGATTAFTFSVIIRDGDTIDGFANASVTASSDAVCNIAQVGNIVFTDSDSATQTFRVEGVSAGSCLLAFTAAENGTESYDTTNIEFIERVGPKVLDIFLTDSIGFEMSPPNTSKLVNEMFYVNITIENVDDLGVASNTITPIISGTSTTCSFSAGVLGLQNVKNNRGVSDLTQSFVVTATSAGTCIIGATTSNGTNTPVAFGGSLVLTFTEPGDAGPITLAWSDQVDDPEFGGFMSIGDTNPTDSNIGRIPYFGASGDSSDYFVPHSIGARVGMVHIRFYGGSDLATRDAIAAEATAANYVESRLALADGALLTTHLQTLRTHLMNIEGSNLPVRSPLDSLKEEGRNYVNNDDRDDLLFYANTNYTNFERNLLSESAQNILRDAGVGRYLRFETKVAGNPSGHTRYITTIPFEDTYGASSVGGVKSRILRNAANTADTNLSTELTSVEADITDLIRIQVSNAPGEGAKVSAKICRLTNFDGVSNININSCANNASPEQTQRILLLDGYWGRVNYGDPDCEFTTVAGNAYSFIRGLIDNTKNTVSADDYYCSTAADAVPIPADGATNERDLDEGDANFPMHIRQFMNTNPHTTDPNDLAKLNDYSLNEPEGYYLITIQAQDSSGTKIPDSNVLKMLFHIGSSRVNNN